MYKLYLSALFCIRLFICGYGQTTVVLSPAMDNTIYQDNTNYSNGAGQNIFAGVTELGGIRRALLKFDLTAIPAGASITAVTLALYCNKTTSGNQATSIHKLLSSWGESSSDAAANEGGGTPAANNDATWVSRFHAGSLWNAPGGDYTGTPSATATVGGASASYSWSSATMISDVRGWLADPASNHGWLLRGNESVSPSTKRFGSRENSSAVQRPRLSVTYNVTVPVMLTSFAVKETASGILLTWETVQEINNDYFSVEHSNDGSHFVPIGKVKGNGNKQGVSNYLFRHEGISEGQHFYRLAQTDFSGLIKYSPVRTVNASKKALTIQVSPNPVIDKINLTSSVLGPGTIFNIINSSGIIVFQGRINQGSINVSSLPTGIYWLRILPDHGNLFHGIFYKN